jgi:hypothetical protein
LIEWLVLLFEPRHESLLKRAEDSLRTCRSRGRHQNPRKTGAGTDCQARECRHHTSHAAPEISCSTTEARIGQRNLQQTWAVRSAPPPARTPARDREARSACGVLLPASAIRHVFLVVVSTPKTKASLAPRCLCLPIMPAGLRARPSAVTLSPVAPRPAPPGETPAFSVDATLGTGHAPSSQHGTAGGTAARRARAAGRRTQRHVCVAAHHGSSSRLADRSNPTGFALVFEPCWLDG